MFIQYAYELAQRKETFAYDALDRLTGATVNAVNASGTPTALVAQYTYGYDGELGNTAGDLIQRTDIGKFNYSPGHAVTHAFGDTPGATAPAAINQGTQVISYTAFLKAETISEEIGDDAYQLTYTYGTDHQRAKSGLEKNGAGIETRIYAGAYEEQRLPGTTNKVHYVNGPGGLCAMIVQAGGTETIYYVYKDHLGSIVTLTSEQGGVVSIAAQQNFDPWGRRRNPTDWTYEDLPTLPDWLYRGFTGHEHVEVFALVNMNGRMYDPLNGRMLSADNYVNGAFDSQAFNRYSYACNNPLKFIDPDGNLAWFIPVIAGALIGGYVGGAIQQGTGGISGANWNPGHWDNSAWNGVMVGALVGAGIGLGVSAGLAASQTSIITGISGPGQIGFSVSGATTTGWNITANALITANVNMASRALQGGDWKQTAVSGLIGLGAGALGGATGSFYHNRGAMSLQGIRAQNYVTSILNGAADRFSRSVDAGLSSKQVASNTILGGLEGLTMAYMLSSKGFGMENRNWIDYMELDPLMNMHVSTLDRTTHVFARYASSFVAQAGVSVPGVGFQLGAAYYTVVGGIYSAGNTLGGFLSAGLLWGPQTRLASSIFNWTGAWDSYEKVGGFRPYTIWGR